MVEKEQDSPRKNRFLEVAERLGIALGVRALWEALDELLTHQGVHF